MIKGFRNIAIISPHPDDETLGVGGSIAKFNANKNTVSILTVSGHLPPLYKKNTYELSKKEAEKAYKILGVKNSKFLKIPATKINEVPIAELNKKIHDFLNKYKPEIVFIPFPDRHIDHKIVFESCMVACRPIGKYYPKIVLAYETLSETHWNAQGVEPSFVPDFFIDISKFIKIKRKALSQYKSQIKNNKTRSIDAVSALAKFRGSQISTNYAEVFKTIRSII